MSNTHNNSEPPMQGFMELAIRDIEHSFASYSTGLTRSIAESVYEKYVLPLLEENEVLKRRVMDLEVSNSSDEGASLASHTCTETNLLSYDEQDDLIQYVYDFAWQYGRLWHLRDYKKILPAIAEKFDLPEKAIPDLLQKSHIGEENKKLRSLIEELIELTAPDDEVFDLGGVLYNIREFAYKGLKKLNSNSIPERSVATEDASSNDAEAHKHLQLIHKEVIKEKEELKQELDNLKNNQ